MQRSGASLAGLLAAPTFATAAPDAYVANNGSANVSQYTLGPDGSLTPNATATAGAGNAPRAIAQPGRDQRLRRERE